MSEGNFKGAGGTSGGVSEFFLGLILTVAGGYLLSANITVTSGFFGWSYFMGGMKVTAFGATLIPMCIGFFWLFFDGESKIGWLLTFGSAAFIFLGIISSLQIYYRSSSLYLLILILGMLMGGLGLLARSLKPH